MVELSIFHFRAVLNVQHLKRKIQEWLFPFPAKGIFNFFERLIYFYSKAELLREGDTRRKILHPPVHSLKGHDGWSQELLLDLH